MTPVSRHSGAFLAVKHIMGDKVDFEMCNLMEGAHKTPEFAAINPYTQIPAFTDTDGTGMGETAAIILYAAGKYGPEYLQLTVGDMIRGVDSPEESEDWAYGRKLLADNRLSRLGWYPRAFAQ